MKKVLVTLLLVFNCAIFAHAERTDTYSELCRQTTVFFTAGFDYMSFVRELSWDNLGKRYVFY